MPSHPSKSEALALRGWRGGALLALIVLACGVRIIWLDASVWTDEAWVINASTAPSLQQAIYYHYWAQTTPPLLIVGLRTAGALGGFNELTFRLIPLLSGCMGVLLVGLTLWRWFAFPVVFAGTGLLAANYWAIKYAQQTKQYSIDLFLSALLLWIVSGGESEGWTKRRWIVLTLTAAVGIFASYTLVFGAGLVAAVFLLDRVRSRADSRSKISWPLGLGTGMTLAAAAASCYWFFVIPSQDARMARDWQNSQLGSYSVASVPSLVSESIGNLLLPNVSQPAKFVGLTLVLFALAGMAFAVRDCLAGRTSGRVSAAAIAPLVLAAAASFAGSYPLLNYPRVVLWSLPFWVLLVCAGVNPLYERLVQQLAAPGRRRLEAVSVCGVLLGCIGAVYLFDRYRGPQEQVREAMLILQDLRNADESIYVHGGVGEQFLFYKRALQWGPGPYHLGAVGWSCCHLNTRERAAAPHADSIREDLKALLDRRDEGRTWILRPRPAGGHWSQVLSPSRIDSEGAMEALGYRLERRWDLGQTALESYIER